MNPDEWWLVLFDNQILSNTEIKRLISWNPLIFLNACYSWKSSSDNEKFYNKTWEDTIGLASSFIIGWSKWVISALWPVNDKIAADFAIEFYKKYLNDTEIWTSLLHTKKEIFMQNPKNPTWASFIYYWDPNLTINI